MSTPEATALDLVLYSESAGHLGNVAAVLADLAESLDGGKLVAAARAFSGNASAQRLGYLLDRVGARRLAAPLAAFLSTRQTWVVPLRPDLPTRRAPRDERWNVLVNEDVDVEP